MMTSWEKLYSVLGKVCQGKWLVGMNHSVKGFSNYVSEQKTQTLPSALCTAFLYETLQF